MVLGLLAPKMATWVSVGRTRSPALRSLTSSPTANTSPATSPPIVVGKVVCERKRMSLGDYLTD